MYNGFMPSHFSHTYRHMAFTPNKDVFVRRAVLVYAEQTLAAYLQGQERAYAVRDVIAELKENFHGGAAYAEMLIEKALASESDDARAALITEALQSIGKQARSDRISAPGLD